MAENCSICLTDLSQGSLAVSDNCIHVHHEACMRQWLASRTRSRWSCPVCRKKVKSIQVILNLPQEIPTPQHEAPNQNVQEENQRPENDNLPAQEDEEEVVILEPPPSPLIENENSQENVGNGGSLPHVELNAGPVFPPPPYGHLEPSFGNQGNVTRIQQGASDIPLTNNFIMLQPVSFSSNPGPSTLAYFPSNDGSSFSSSVQVPVVPGSSQSHEFQRAQQSTSFSAARSSEGLECEICHAEFRLRNSLHRHIQRVHRNQFLCPTCGRRFTQRIRYEQHLIHHRLE